jgi:hypothetical protein
MGIYKATRKYKVIWTALVAFILIGCSNNTQTSVPREETPTDVLRKIVEATQKKDAEMLKQTLSSGSLRIIEDSARKENLTLDEALRRDGGTSLTEVPETRNEIIEGDTATVEVRNTATADWDKIPFVREEGKWKLALDKIMRDLMNK